MNSTVVQYLTDLNDTKKLRGGGATSKDLLKKFLNDNNMISKNGIMITTYIGLNGVQIKKDGKEKFVDIISKIYSTNSKSYGNDEKSFTESYFNLIKPGTVNDKISWKDGNTYTRNMIRICGSYLSLKVLKVNGYLHDKFGTQPRAATLGLEYVCDSVSAAMLYATCDTYMKDFTTQNGMYISGTSSQKRLKKVLDRREVTQIISKYNVLPGDYDKFVKAVKADSESNPDENIGISVMAINTPGGVNKMNITNKVLYGYIIQLQNDVTVKCLAN